MGLFHRRSWPQDQELLSVDEFEAAKCQHCGGVHLRACPRVKKLQFYENGNIAAVEFWRTWAQENIMWPEELHAADE